MKKSYQLTSELIHEDEFTTDEEQEESKLQLFADWLQAGANSLLQQAEQEIDSDYNCYF